MAEFIPLLPEEEGNDTSWYTAGAAGIASGIIKIYYLHDYKNDDLCLELLKLANICITKK